MTTPKERMSEEQLRWAREGLADPLPYSNESARDEISRLLNHIDALRAELTAAERERDEARAALAQARTDALEEAAKVADDRVEPMRLLGVKNKESCPIESERCHARAIEANHIAAMIRCRKSLTLTPTQESETP